MIDWRAVLDAEVRAMQQTLDKYGIDTPPCGSSVGVGWIPIVDECLGRLIAAGWDKQLAQIKQKFLGLRIYLDGPHNETFAAIVREAEDECEVTCELCGAPRERTGSGVGRATCNRCREELSRG